MRITIDGAGRVVIPKSVRDAAGLEGGTELEIRFRDGRIEIEPTSAEMRLVQHPEGATIEAEGEMPSLSAAEVRSVLEHVRR